MPNNNFIREITSKDRNVSKNIILNMIKSVSIADFSELCEKGDFIFPFLKERIIDDFVKLINKENLKAVFEFSKIYCADFENIIVNSWLKYADEDLTDEILELFEKGTLEQKAYCAKYFKYVKDSLALEFLNKYAYSDFEPLKINCAQTLGAFGDKNVYNQMKHIVLESNDDFEKMSAYSFDSINFITDNYFSSPFRVNIVSNLLDYNDFEVIKKLEQNKIIEIFTILLEGYPEDIGLETLGYYRVLDFIKLINSFNNQYAINSLILAREKFKEFNNNDIYLYDLDKNTKTDLKEIYDYLNSLPLNMNNFENELKEFNTKRYELALDIIQELKLSDYAHIIACNMEKINDTNIAKTALILKELNKTDLIPSEILNEIQNENVRILVKSFIK